MLTVQTKHSLQSVTEAAMAIQERLTGGKFDHTRAQELAEQLYKNAQDLIRAECYSRPLFKEPVTSVALTLDEIVSMPTIQHLDDLHRALSKTYRVFIELTWFQCWRQKSRRTVTTSMDAIINHSELMKKLLPKDQFLARFEYSCARQATQFLNPTDSIWIKYLELAPRAIGAGVSLSVGEMLGVLKDVLVYAKRDWIKEWYLDVHNMRWLSTTVKTIDDFVKKISPRLAEFKQKGGKHSECLAVICIELVRDPQVDKECRKRAAGELSQLFSLVDERRIPTALKAAESKLPNVELVSTAARKADRYMKTREIIQGFLGEVINNKELQECRPLLKESFSSRSILENPALSPDKKGPLSIAVQGLVDKREEKLENITELEIRTQTTKGSAETQDGNAKAQMEEERQNIERINAQITVLKHFEEECKQEEKKLKNLIEKL